MEIKNVTLFFIGIIILILGALIIIFDFPQIQYFDKMGLKSYQLLHEEQKEIHQRLVWEFFVGVIVSGLGILVLMTSFLNRFENGIRQR
jgi:hypothetical protein